MPDIAYDHLSSIYDSFPDDSDTVEISERIHSLITKFAPKRGDGEKGRLILCDLGCGTGRVTSELAREGYEIIGVDISEGMLSVAKETFSECGREAQFICQDISRLDLFGTADVFIAVTDTINHLTDRRDFRRLFSSFRNFLNPGGLFIFDALTLHYMQNVRGDHDYQEITDEYVLLWRNRFSKAKKKSVADMTLFSKIDDDTYSRSDFSVHERYYSSKDIRAALVLADMELIGIYGGYRDSAPRKTDIRHLYVARKKTNVDSDRIDGSMPMKGNE